MDLKDMILVTENDRGTETNMLMTLDDYKSFIAVDDMSELADNLLQLGRTLGKPDNFTEYLRDSVWMIFSSDIFFRDFITIPKNSGLIKKPVLLNVLQSLRRLE
mgnify:CR=1 FL=1